jgi:mannose-1-phosphate guanylyltransferase / phosphomannomutase
MRLSRAAFLDRDGVICEDVDQLHKIEELKLIPRSAEAIQLLNKNGYLTIIVTNQPMVARGLCTEEDVQRINQELVEMVADAGGRIDAVYYCPHHPETNHPEANDPKYRRECECRKPKPGMIKQAAKDLGVDLSKCYIIGDRTADIKTGENAGIKTILVRTGAGGNDKKYIVKPDYTCQDLYEAAELIIKGK